MSKLFKHLYKEGFTTIIVVSFTLLMLALSIYSLYFGISPHDEAFYISIPYSFALGNIPFVNEYHIAQTASLYLFPFIKLYLYWVGSSKGIVLFSRWIYFLLTLSISSIIFLIFKRIIQTWAALLIALVCLVFVPFNLHDVCYNTLSMLFLSLSFIFGFCATSETYTKTRRNSSYYYAFLCGGCQGIVTVAYPPLMIIAFIYMIFLFCRLPNKKTIFYYVAGAFLTGGWILIYLYHAGWQQLSIDFHYDKSFGLQGGDINKILLVFNQLRSFASYKIVIMALFILELIFHKKFRWVTEVLYTIILVIFVAEVLKIANYISSTLLLTNFACFGILLFIRIFKNANSIDKNIFLMVWLPATFSGLLTGWSSSNGAYNFIIGAFSAALVSIYFVIRICYSENINSQENYRISFGFLIPIILISALQYYNVFYTYEDVNLPQLSVKMTSGPFEGLYTTKNKVVFYNTLESDLNNVAKLHKSILFFDDFPAGYLFTKLKPATNSTWLFSPAYWPSVDRKATLLYFKRTGDYPDVVVKMFYVPSVFAPIFYKKIPNDPVHKFTRLYLKIIERSDYQLFIAPKNIHDNFASEQVDHSS